MAKTRRGVVRLEIMMVRTMRRVPAESPKRAMTHQWMALNHQGVDHDWLEEMEIAVVPRK